ncbi:MAG: Ribosomal RNA small subunit methyltransferase A [Parcubacteria group bacterium GW2011_GWF2_44_8b]|nr:MAG: Ribosomal RNA small subunit methyltransferase A [Parcubacteria group bacterium GW2011_GWC1_43_30]KKT79151.1 MAG: Ribosomal RNA small subunit methyltransferase A [Parcubacteria group bacterium GW2011_GWF2_44_8b]
MRAKKSLGQHFLKSERAISKIVEAGDLVPDDAVLEIGPGEGVLTEKLLAVGCKVIAVEKDDALFEFLKEKFYKEIKAGKLELVHDDILNFKLKIEHYKLIANIPYNITGAILKKFLGAKNQPKTMALLVQKEVAKRIIRRPLGGSASKWGKESILSISVKAYGTPRYVETVKAGSFVPMPKIDSAIIAIENISKQFFQGFREDDFFKTLKTGFKSKRKKLSSNLSTIFGKNKIREVFQKLNLDDNLRAEDVGIETWGKLVSALSS